MGYESNLLVINLGTMYITLVIMLMTPICICTTRPCKDRSKWLQRKRVGLLNALHGNMFIRFLIEGCLDVSICIYCQYLFTAESEEGMSWSSRFEIVNNISMLVLATALISFPIFIVVFYCRKFVKWEDEDF